jgi:hypothetical protein
MEDELHIPWTNETLEKLVLEIIKTGEASKVDFKSSLTLGTAGEKAELSKDIQAFANSYDQPYRNHGFIIIGAAPGKLLYSSFSQNVDQMQATIDQIVREHLGPFVSTQVRHFGDAGKTWGVIVVLPSRNAPHVFIRETDKFKRGDIYVRSGTTTSKAEPSDFARFYRVQLEDHTREMREELRDVQREIANLKKQGPATVISVAPGTKGGIAAPTSAKPHVAASSSMDFDLLSSIDQVLARFADPVSNGLSSQAHAIRSLLDSKEIPWDLNNLTKESGRAVIERINATASKCWEALARLIENDDAGQYDDAVIEALSQLAFEPEAPAGTGYTNVGTGIRLYPLVMCLYIVFMIGLRKKRDKLLRRVITLKLSRRSYYEEPSAVGYSLFYVRRADEVFQTTRDEYPGQRWCDGVGSYIERWISAHLTGAMPELERNKHFFYIGEFALSILGAVTPNIARPAQGLFFYIGDSQPIIARYLKTEGTQFQGLFGGDLKVALSVFDTWGSRIANSGRCWGDGFQSGALEAVFPSEQPAKT